MRVVEFVFDMSRPGASIARVRAERVTKAAWGGGGTCFTVSWEQGHVYGEISQLERPEAERMWEDIVKGDSSVRWKQDSGGRWARSVM